MFQHSIDLYTNLPPFATSLISLKMYATHSQLNFLEQFFAKSEESAREIKSPEFFCYPGESDNSTNIVSVPFFRIELISFVIHNFNYKFKLHGLNS